MKKRKRELIKIDRVLFFLFHENLTGQRKKKPVDFQIHYIDPLPFFC